MNYTIITSIIGGFTSIIVALIASGYFKKFFDEQKDKKSKKDLAKQIERNDIIQLSLSEIKRKYFADRIIITQFHNGGSYYTNTSIQKFSITYERISGGLEPIAGRYQSILVSNFSWYYAQVMENNCYFYSILNDITDLATRSIISSRGVNSHIMVPIFDKNKNLVASLGLDWIFSEVPENLINEKKFIEEFREIIFKEAQSLLTYL